MQLRKATARHNTSYSIFAFLSMILFYVVAFNPDYRNNDLLWHGSQLLIIASFLINNGRIIKADSYLKWIVVYSLYMLISSIWSYDKTEAINTFVSMTLILLSIYSIYGIIENYYDIIACMFCMIISLVYNGIYAVSRVGFLNYIGVPNLYYWAANSTSLRYAIGFVIILILLKNIENKWQKLSTVVSIPVIIYTLIYCGSRGALILVAVTLIFWIINRPIPLYQKVLFICVMVGLIYGIYRLFLQNTVLYNIIGKRFDYFNKNYDNGGITNAEPKRLELIKTGLQMFIDRPLVGYGHNAFYNFSTYHCYSHNDYIEMLSEGGVLGTLIYYSIYYLMFKHINLIVIKEHGFDATLMIGFLFGLVVFNFVAITKADVAVHSMFCVMMALIKIRTTNGIEYTDSIKLT